jgi:hypothetical protein
MNNKKQTPYIKFGGEKFVRMSLLTEAKGTIERLRGELKAKERESENLRKDIQDLSQSCLRRRQEREKYRKEVERLQRQNQWEYKRAEEWYLKFMNLREGLELLTEIIQEIPCKERVEAIREREWMNRELNEKCALALGWTYQPEYDEEILNSNGEGWIIGDYIDFKPIDKWNPCGDWNDAMILRDDIIKSSLDVQTTYLDALRPKESEGSVFLFIEPKDVTLAFLRAKGVSDC